MRRKSTIVIIAVALAFMLLSGCSGSYAGVQVNNSLPAETESNTEKGNSKTETVSSESADVADWKPTKYDIVNNFEGVSMTVKEGTVSPSGLTVVLESKISGECIYGSFYSLEKEIDGKWCQVPVAIEGAYAFSAIGYSLPSGESRELSVDWKWLYGDMGTGKYRIVKDISDFRGTGDYDVYYLAAEFSIN
jgi:outer membrane murein-binding lipoprotein Lpp